MMANGLEELAELTATALEAAHNRIAATDAYLAELAAIVLELRSSVSKLQQQLEELISGRIRDGEVTGSAGGNTRVAGRQGKAG